MDAPAAQRLFFALWPDAPARAALSRLAAEVAHHVHGRATRQDNLHVTLAFLGNVGIDRVDAVHVAGVQAAAAVDPFDLALERVGGSAYGIAWLTPDPTPAPLRALHETLACALEGAGFPREKRMFRPHVTLARDGVRSAQRGGVAPIAWRVDTLALVASTPAAGGSRYRDLARWPLARRA